jgi:hypothetical protein
MAMFGSEDANLENMLAALAAYRGLRSDEMIARAVRKSGYKVSQQSVSNYRRGKKMPPAGFMVGFIKALGIDGEQRRELLSAWMQKNPDIEELYRLL